MHTYQNIIIYGNQRILLMITDEGKKWHYLAKKSISGLLRGITLNHNGDFYCLNCLQSYRTKEKIKKHEKVSNNYDYCYVKMPNGFEEILKYHPGERSLKIPFIIYSDLECLLEKMDSCQNDLKKSSTEKKLSIHLQVTHGFHVVHLMHQKTNRVIIEEKTVWKCSVKI